MHTKCPAGPPVGYVYLIGNQPTEMSNTNTVRIFDLLGLFPESKDGFRYVTVRTYAQAEEIMAEQNKLGNRAVIMNWWATWGSVHNFPHSPQSRVF